jgi:hypothetical protein
VGVDGHQHGRGLRFGGYLVDPGSVVDGREYAIEVDARIALLPGWMAL